MAWLPVERCPPWFWIGIPLFVLACLGIITIVGAGGWLLYWFFSHLAWV